VNIDTIVDAMTKLGLLEGRVDALYKSLERCILRPMLEIDHDGASALVQIEGDTIQIEDRTRVVATAKLFAQLNEVVQYLSTHLPLSVTNPLSKILLPTVTSRIITDWLNPTVPSSLDGQPELQDTLSQARTFHESLRAVGWEGKSELGDWVNRASRTWLTKRREVSLDNVRRLLSAGLGETKVVEHVETQMVKRGEISNGGGDDWDAKWSDDEEGIAPDSTASKTSHEGDDDVDAWGGFDDEVADEAEVPTTGTAPGEEDDAGEAWGWGDDDKENKEKESPESPVKPKAVPNGKKARKEPAQTEKLQTLRENYIVSSIPDDILATINQVLLDADTLVSPK
jgi:protein transport protein DSL1/ZW10